MNPKNTAKHTPATPSVSAEDFPALQDFLRGYFHEDMIDDYGSAAGAVEQFAEDADYEQRRSVANEWELFRRRTKEQPVETVNRLLGELGSACAFSSLDQVKKISSIFAKTVRDD